jgi:hypothetical protein
MVFCVGVNLYVKSRSCPCTCTLEQSRHVLFFLSSMFCDVVAHKNQLNTSDLQKNWVKIW